MGITTLEIIQNCLGLIGSDIFDKFPDNDKLDDSKVFELLNSNNLTYVFQLDGKANRIAIDAIGGVHDFEDIVITTSVARPGASQFISQLSENRKSGTMSYVHNDMSKILDNTYGVLLYQEQVMQIAKDFASFSMAEIDDIKELIKSKEHSEFEAMKPKFIKGCIKNGYNKKIALNIWKIIENASGYLYNRSHAVSYSVITYQTAYLKSHYPLEFFVSCMNINKPNEDKIKNLVQESLSLNIEVLRPDIHKSDVSASIEENSIRLGLSNVRNVGVRTAQHIVDARSKGGSKAILELPRRVITSRVLSTLQDVGAFGDKYIKIDREQELLGFLLHDPISEYKDFIDDHSKETSGYVIFGGLVTNKRRLKTRKGDDMAFVDMSVDGDTKNLALFAEQLYRFDDHTSVGNILLVKAKKQDGYDSVIPENIKVLNNEAS